MTRRGGSGLWNQAQHEPHLAGFDEDVGIESEGCYGSGTIKRLTDEAGSAACSLCEACPVDMARGIDQVRTCGAQNGFRILEQHGLILGYKVLKFPAFVRGETSLIVLVEEPVKPCLALDVESLQLDRYGGFSDGAGHKYLLSFSNRLPGLYRGRASLSNAECRCKLPHTPDFPDLRMFCYARTRIEYI